MATSWLRPAIIASTVALGVGGGSVALLHHSDPPSQLEQAANGCGIERWPVKTGSDPGATAVDISRPTATTVADLRALPAPNSAVLLADQSVRANDTERTAFRLTGVRLVAYKLEADSDYHLVLADAAGLTMIAEIPKPSCVDPISPWSASITQTRAIFDAQFPGAEMRTQFVNANVALTSVTGVGFFDILHGQRGVAPNGIELHAVTDISFG